jgi:hypothetical protein
MPSCTGHRPALRAPIRPAAAILSLGILLAGCGEFGAGSGNAGAGPTMVRAVVVDQPVGTDPAAEGDSGDPGGDPAASSSTGKNARGESGATDTPRPPTPVAMDNAGFATELASTAGYLKGASDRIGQVLEIPPADCGAISMASDAIALDCEAEALRAGRHDGREYVGLLVFDLSDLPLGAARDSAAPSPPGLAEGAGAELLYAALELSGLDDASAEADASWSLRAVQLSADWPPADFSFGRLMGLAPADPSLVWRLRAADFPPDRAAGLDLEGAALAALQAAMGRGLLALRIEALSSGAAAYGLLTLHASGERAPRLRLAYFEPAAAP